MALTMSRQVTSTKDDAGLAAMSTTIATHVRWLYLRQAQLIAVTCALVAGIVGVFATPEAGLAVLIGAATTLLVGLSALNLTAGAVYRVALLSKDATPDALRQALRTGTAIGLLSTGLTLVVVAATFFLLGGSAFTGVALPTIDALLGFALGSATVALLNRLGGGIFTKSADIGADIVGQVEAGLGPDDPRNPAALADACGDQLGSAAAAACEFSEVYATSLVAAMALGLAVAMGAAGGLPGDVDAWASLPLLLGASGLVSCIVATFVFTSGKGDIGAETRMTRSYVVGGLVSAVAGYLVVAAVIGVENIGLYISFLLGILGGMVTALLSEKYTTASGKKVAEIAESSRTGSATNIIAGLGNGLEATGSPTIVLLIVVIAAYAAGFSYSAAHTPQAGVLGIALAGVGLLSVTGITLGISVNAAITDSANGLWALCGNKAGKARETLTASGKAALPYARSVVVASSLLAALSLVLFFGWRVGEACGTQPAGAAAVVYNYVSCAKVMAGGALTVNISDPYALVGLFIGGMMPFLITAHVTQTASRTAVEIVTESRRQLKDRPNILGGSEKPDYDAVIKAGSNASLAQLGAPAVIALGIPLLMGLALPPTALAGLIAGVTATGLLLAMMLILSGAGWDSARQSLEFTKTDSQEHKASVVGDTVGDSFKDAAGPALNVLIRVTALTAIILLPLFLSQSLIR
jgi:K(+)-stimulated pyrophosphate-energized sodium pump